MDTTKLYQEKPKEELIQMLLAMQLKEDEQQSEKENLNAVIYDNQTTIDEHQKTIVDYEKVNNELRQQITILTEAIKLAKLRQYGAKSEKLCPDQLSIFDEATLPDNVDEIESADEDIHIPAHSRKKKTGRKALPKELPRIEKEYDLPESEKICDCGCALTYINDEVTEQLELIPAKVYVIVHKQKKYACRQCSDTIKCAKKPPQPIPRSIAGPTLLASILANKYQLHLPLYRQEKMMKKMGVDIARNTLSLWVIRCSELLLPLEKLMQDNILSYDIAYSDESNIQVLKEKDRAPQTKSWMWLFAGGAPEQFSFIYRYDTSRGHEVPLAFFEDYQGFLHCDGFSAYEKLVTRNTQMTLSGCLYHVRRKFVDASKLNKKKSGVAYQILKLIQKIAKHEQEIMGKPSDIIFNYRLKHIKPIFDALHDLLIEKQPKIPPKSTLGGAITYALNQWEKLMVHFQDGRLENNNNRTERGIKPFALGRRNWLFSCSAEGAAASARIYSFIETCKFHDIDAYYYFAYVLREIPQCTTLQELEALLPYNIDKKLLHPRNFIPEFPEP